MSAHTLRRASLLAVALAIAPVAQAAPRSPVERAHRALLQMRVEDAAKLIATAPPGADTSYVLALVRLDQGDYEGALHALDASIARAPLAGKNDDRRSLRALLVATRNATKNFVKTTSADGRFIVFHDPGPDDVLVPYALDTMRAADAAIAKQLGMRVPGPVRLEIYPTPEALAQVSTLSVQAIERTGTIALCKWDRLMITSPGALVRGYPWMDTISHEFVHLVLTRASRDKAPVWLQEGVAKFLERTWRGGPPTAHLDPASAALLRHAVDHDSLIPFARLHPSIALLPSQEDAALAFAQVATFVQSFYRAYGAKGLQRAVAEIARGVDARKALADVAGIRFSQLEASWKTALAQRPEPPPDAPELQAVRFRKGKHMDESLEVHGQQARRFLRLGDLLWSRQRPKAAAAEYAKAYDAAPDDPIVASRLAHAALAAGDPDRALEAIDPILERYPDHEPAYSIRGSALLAKGDLSDSAEASREAIRLNPFDPRPHCDLAMSSQTRSERDRERTWCRRLGNTQSP